MDEILKLVGLTMAQYAAMGALKAEPGMSSTRLARVCFVTAQTMQGVLSHLESTDIVKRTTDPANAHISRGELTTEGVEVLSRAHPAVPVVEARMAASVGKQMVGPMSEALFKCAEDLEAQRYSR